MGAITSAKNPIDWKARQLIYPDARGLANNPTPNRTSAIEAGTLFAPALEAEPRFMVRNHPAGANCAESSHSHEPSHSGQPI